MTMNKPQPNEITQNTSNQGTNVPGRLSLTRLVSGYVAVATIMGLCIWQAAISSGIQMIFYIILAVIAAAFGVFVSIMYAKQKRSDKNKK